MLLLEGAALLLLAVILGVDDWVDDRRDDRQDACFAEKITDLTAALDVRGELGEREAKVARVESRAAKIEGRASARATAINQKFYEEAFAATTTDGFFAAYGNYRASMVEVNEMRDAAAELRRQADTRRDRIKRDRELNPIPAFPEGTCVRNTDGKSGEDNRKDGARDGDA